MKSRCRPKRGLTLYALLLGIGCSLCAHAADDNWLILHRQSTPNPEIVSVVRVLPSPDMRSDLPTLMEIAWRYRAMPNGLPVEEELIYARTLYEEIDKLVGANGIHAMTRTGDGGRTMYYYVRDSDALRSDIRSFFDAQPPISVEVSVRPDPNWDAVQRMLDGIKQ